MLRQDLDEFWELFSQSSVARIFTYLRVMLQIMLVVFTLLNCVGVLLGLFVVVFVLCLFARCLGRSTWIEKDWHLNV